MEKITRLFKAALLAGVFAIPCLGAVAQDYEDDLYYSPSQARRQQQAAQAAQQAADNAAGLGSADLYTAGSSNPLRMDVDTYNRRTVAADTLAAAAAGATPAFSYTRRIERFHNPDIVSASNDTTLMEYYYSTPSEQDINVYVINNVDPAGSFWGSPAYPSYAYSPYYSWNYAYPSFSFGWNSAWGWNMGWNWGYYDPYWAYSWGWGYRPWYGPAWGWGPSWGWHHHHHHPVAVRPWGYDRPGASRPHYPAYGAGSSHRPSNSGYRPGNRPDSSRPGNFGYPAGNWGAGNNHNGVRPTTPVTPGNNNSYTPSNNDRRGRNNGYNSGNSNSGNRYSSPSRNNSGSRYSSPSTGSGSRGGGYRSPGSGSRGGGGGSHGGGGGGGRGRGR